MCVLLYNNDLLIFIVKLVFISLIILVLVYVSDIVEFLNVRN